MHRPPVCAPRSAMGRARRMPRSLVWRGAPPTRRTPRAGRGRRRAGTDARARGERVGARSPVAARSRRRATAHRPSGSGPCRSARRTGVGSDRRRAPVPPRRTSSARRRGAPVGGPPCPPRPAGAGPRPEASLTRRPRDRAPRRRTHGAAGPRAGRARGPPRSSARSPRRAHGSRGGRHAACCPAGRPTPPAAESGDRAGVVRPGRPTCRRNARICGRVRRSRAAAGTRRLSRRRSARGGSWSTVPPGC